MPRPCSICGHADVAAIDRALKKGDSLDVVSKRFGLSRPSVQRHRAQHLGTKPGATPAKFPAQSRAIRNGKAKSAGGSATSGTEPKGAPKCPPPDREGRVRACMELMTGGRWESGVTANELAAEWGMTPGAVAHISSEASRRVKAVGEHDFVRTRIAAALDEGLAIALGMARGSKANGVVVPGDPRALAGLASIAKAFKELAGSGSKPADPDGNRFIVELVSPERPVPCSPQPSSPPSGDSSPPTDAPATS